MEKIDRLGWTVGISLTAYGVRVGIRVNRAELLPRIASLLPPGWKPVVSQITDRLYSLIVGNQGTRIRGLNLLYVGARRLARTLDLDEALEALESDLQLYVAENAKRRLFVHAGVVAWKGSAIVIPGRTYSGKSTLVAAFIRAGATYYSDEYAALDERGRVHPYPRMLSLRQAVGDVSRTTVEAGVRAVPVRFVVVTKYREGARWRPRALSQGEGVLRLLANTIPARSRPAAALSILRKAVSGAVILSGRRGEADEVVRLMLSETFDAV